MVSSPKPPDPYKQAAAQQSSELGASMGSSIINNPNQVNPYGSQSYSLAGYETIYDATGKQQYVPRYTQTTTLSPDQQRLLGLQTQTQYNMGQTGVEASSRLRDYLGKGVDTSKAQAWNAGPNAASLATSFGGTGDYRQDTAPTDRTAIEKALMGRYQENAGKSSRAEDAQLAARGLSPGSQQYTDVSDTRSRALTDASQQAYLASGQESRAQQEAYNQAQTQRYQEALARAGFGNEAQVQQYNMGGQTADRQNALRAQQMQEIFSLRNQPLNEISALLAGSQVATPQFNPFSAQGIGAAPVGSYIGQNYANAANSASQMNAGLFGFGGDAMKAFAMSDRRLKEDIEPLGMHLAGLPLYSFRFIGKPHAHVGVMADEARELHPDAVHRVGDYDAVDYGLLLARHGGH